MISLPKADWRKEIARDSLALGSILFYFIVIIRAGVGQHSLFVAQVVIAIIVLFLLSRVIKNSNHHLARGFALAVFTSLFYRDRLFTIFAFVLLGILIVSLNYLGIKRNVILNGLLLGIASAGISYYLSPLLV